MLTAVATHQTNGRNQTIESHACSPELMHVIAQIMDNLPAAEKQVVFLTMFKGLTHREIAEQTRVPLRSVKARLATGTRKIRVAMSQPNSTDEGAVNLEAA